MGRPLSEWSACNRNVKFSVTNWEYRSYSLLYSVSVKGKNLIVSLIVVQMNVSLIPYHNAWREFSCFVSQFPWGIFIVSTSNTISVINPVRSLFLLSLHLPHLLYCCRCFCGGASRAVQLCTLNRISLNALKCKPPYAEYFLDEVNIESVDSEVLGLVFWQQT